VLWMSCRVWSSESIRTGYLPVTLRARPEEKKVYVITILPISYFKSSTKCEGFSCSSHQLTYFVSIPGLSPARHIFSYIIPTPFTSPHSQTIVKANNNNTTAEVSNIRLRSSTAQPNAYPPPYLHLLPVVSCLLGSLSVCTQKAKP